MNNNENDKKWGSSTDDKLNGWSIIYSAPYSPKSCPIELKWAYGKNYVAHPDQFHKDRTCSDVIKLFRKRYYTKEGQFVCHKQIRNCKEFCDKFMKMMIY